MNATQTFLKSQRFSFVLIGSIIVGTLIGSIFGPDAKVLEPLGRILLNALYVSIVPLIFFSIASAVAGIASSARLFRIIGTMLVVFTATGLLAAVIMLGVVNVFPPAEGVHIVLEQPDKGTVKTVSQMIVDTLTVPDFSGLLSKQNVLPLIIFSVLVGLGTSDAGEKGRAFAAFLQSANDVFMKVISYIMLYAPVGLAGYFAYFVGQNGADFIGAYLRSMAVYYPVCIVYFLAAFTLYAYLAGGGWGVRTFWTTIPSTALMATASCSSFATIPMNLQAADRIGVPRDISEVVIPVGATIHMDGSVLAAMLKIAFLYGIFGMSFDDPATWATAIGVALLSGMVMSGIPGGGFTGELLIVTLCGFPPEALVIINVIGALVDPPATAVNAVGDNVCSMLVARILGGRKWMERKPMVVEVKTQPAGVQP